MKKKHIEAMVLEVKDVILAFFFKYSQSDNIETQKSTIHANILHFATNLLTALH